MTDSLQIHLAQINLRVGDIETNTDLVRLALNKAKEAQADVVVFPELTLCGYPPEDLLLRPAFVASCKEALVSLQEATKGLTAIVGLPLAVESGLVNAAAILQNGEWIDSYHKIELPNYGVFDEKRYFVAGDTPCAIEVKGKRLAVSICEDVWVQGGALDQWIPDATLDGVLNLSASPFHYGKGYQREDIMTAFAKRHGLPFYMCNLIGGQDELVFDGRSFACNIHGQIIQSANAFETATIKSQLPLDGVVTSVAPELQQLEEVYRALVLGVKDYVGKIGVKRVLIGLSGGIDSGLVAAIAVAAFGSENVVGVSMPSMYSSPETRSDAQKLADNLGIEFYEIPIKGMFDAGIEAMGEALGDGKPGLEQENLQARIRGGMLMTLSNRHGWLVLTTGNKSEYAVGYCTLYGDMCGGYAVIKDVPKLMVFDLCRYINQKIGRDVIPQTIIDRPPSAELRPDQKDEDSLPPYEVLDVIVQAYVEDDKSPADIIAMGYDKSIVADMIKLIDRSEFKRRQAPPGVKITPKAFGRDRRMPIANRYAH